MERYWFLTWRTYGTWLPGEAGFVGNYVLPEGQRVTDNRYGDLAGPAMPALAAYAAESMTHPPVYLSQPQADHLLEQFAETALYRGRELEAVAVLSNHVHMVFGTPGDPDPDEMLADWKTYASRALNRLVGWRPPAPRPVWWARDGSKRIVKTTASRAGVIRYVRDQENPLVIWLSEAATQLLVTYPDEAWADALGEPRP